MCIKICDSIAVIVRAPLRVYIYLVIMCTLDGHDGDKPVWLLSRQQIPPHLRFNRFVLNHYRPQQDWLGCLKSLFYLHNETVNVLTHGAPIVAILATLSTILPWEDISIEYLPTVHVAAFISPWVGSTAYHLFMNHYKGEGVYKRLLSLDMLGIWIAQNAGSLTPLIATFYCKQLEWQIFVWTLYALGCTFSLYKAMTARCPWERRYSFTLPFMFRLALLTARLSGFGDGNPMSLKHLVVQDVFAITGAFIGATNIPERWFPGQLDLALNSHNFMHVMVLVAAYQMHLAVVYDLGWMSAVRQGALSCPA